MKNRTIKLTTDELESIKRLLSYGRDMVVAQAYPRVSSVYDEDAGVFSDYGENKTENIWAGVHLTNLLTTAIASPVQTDRTTVNWTMLDIAIPAVVQFLIACFDSTTQRAILTRAYGYEYESDGHYSGATRSDYISRRIDETIIGIKIIKKIIEKMEA